MGPADSTCFLEQRYCLRGVFSADWQAAQSRVVFCSRDMITLFLNEDAFSEFLFFCGSGFGLLGGTLGEAVQDAFIMRDDHERDAIGVLGGWFAGLSPTPKLDRLAEESLFLRTATLRDSVCIFGCCRGVSSALGSMIRERGLKEVCKAEARSLKAIVDARS